MADHSQDRRDRLGSYARDMVLPDLPPGAEALADRVVQRLYLRRWLLALSAAVILVFLIFYGLPLVPAGLGFISILAGAGFIPREGVLRPLLLNLGENDRLASSQTIDAMLGGLPSPVILLDAQGRVLIFNRLASEFWPNLRQDSHISSFIRDPGVLEGVAEANSSMRSTKMVPYEQRVPIERHMEATIGWIGGRSASLIERAPVIMLHLRDLTEQEQLNRLRTDFVANASHELRTPLASLIGFIETLQGAARNDSAAREHFLEIMARQAKRMARLIDNLLSLSRIEMRMHLKPQDRVDLAKIAKNVLTDLEPLAEQTSVRFHFENEAGEAWVMGDRDELFQVVSNLVENSIKYGRKGGNVWLTIQPAGQNGAEKYTVTVRDDGEGIEEKHLPRLTERFYRANDNGGEKSGTGLGLAIVKHVIARHRGELQIASDLGKGSSFKIALNKAPAEG
jgi:two-component system phosphate regulon sensor histidine kinase PhoR